MQQPKERLLSCAIGDHLEPVRCGDPDLLAGTSLNDGKEPIHDRLQCVAAVGVDQLGKLLHEPPQLPDGAAREHSIVSVPPQERDQPPDGSVPDRDERQRGESDQDQEAFPLLLQHGDDGKVRWRRAPPGRP